VTFNRTQTFTYVNTESNCFPVTSYNLYIPLMWITSTTDQKTSWIAVDVTMLSNVSANPVVL